MSYKFYDLDRNPIPNSVKLKPMSEFTGILIYDQDNSVETSERWYLDGQYHRFDGPAISYPGLPDDAQAYLNEYWVYGKKNYRARCKGSKRYTQT